MGFNIWRLGRKEKARFLRWEKEGLPEGGMPKVLLGREKGRDFPQGLTRTKIGFV